jgi:hypothetical protein
LDGIWVSCQDHTPPAALSPNPVGYTLAVGVNLSGHAALAWQAPLADAGHDAATLYRIMRGTSAAGPFVEVGSATSTAWLDIDALVATESYYYKVLAENAGGTE